ncbi:MAG: aminoacyltransferase [Bacteroidia bacterium]|nr:aminoacyltransferase [Bacteroidia bacterium]
MIRYLKHTEIDQNKWDLCIEQSANALVYAYSWYLNIASPNWEALVLDDYLAVMPLTAHRKYFISYLSQPFFTQQLGVFTKASLLSQDILESFIQSIPKKFRFIDIQLNEQNQVLNPKLKIRKRRNYVLDLSKAYEKISKSYNTQNKRNLKKAKKYELSIQSIGFKEVVLFYKSHKALTTKGVKDADYMRLQQLMEEANVQHKLICKGVYDKSGELLASGAFLAHKNRIIFLLGNGSELGKEKGAMTLLMDSIIFLFADHKMILDFEGSEIEGIARFFKSFGAEKRNYYRLKVNRLPWILRVFKN